MKLRITHISDTHNKHKQLNGKLPGGDLLIHSGDFTSIGREHEVEGFIKWFNEIDNYTNKVFIAGNHDLTFESEIPGDLVAAGYFPKSKAPVVV